MSAVMSVDLKSCFLEYFDWSEIIISKKKKIKINKQFGSFQENRVLDIGAELRNFHPTKIQEIASITSSKDTWNESVRLQALSEDEAGVKNGITSSAWEWH